MKFDPPEAQPGASVTATGFVVTPGGATMPAIDWSLCLTPKSTTNNDVVDPACLQPGGTMEIATTDAPQSLTLPSDALPPLRPRHPAADARPTAGAEIARARRSSAATIIAGAPRSTAHHPPSAWRESAAGFAGASAAIAAEYAAEYTSNNNPTLTPLSAFVDGTPIALDAIPAGRAITLAAGWTADSPETFPVLDPAARNSSSCTVRS